MAAAAALPPPLPSEKQSKFSKSLGGAVGFIGVILLLAWIGNSADKPTTASPPPESNTALQQPDLDNSNEPPQIVRMEECVFRDGGINLVSWSEGSKICELTTNSLGQPLPIGVFRSLLKAAAVLHLKGAGETEQIAYQLAELIEARGIADPQRMKETMDIAFKAYNESNGRVTPKDLNVAVRQSSLGHTLSDEGLFGLAAMISVQKRNNGE